VLPPVYPELAGFSVRSVLVAEFAMLFELHAVWMSFFVFFALIVTLFALCAS